eukprot:UN12913
MGKIVFHPYLKKFVKYETEQLEMSWDNVRWVSENPLNKLTFQDIYQRIIDTNHVVFSAGTDSVKSFLNLTGGGKIQFILTIINTYFNTF